MNEGAASEDSVLSLKELITEQRRWLRTIALSRLRNAEAAEEVVQNAIVAALDAVQRGIQIQKPQPWLYRVLIRQCLLYRRKLGRQRKAYERLEQGWLGETQDEAEAIDPLNGLLVNERQQTIGSVIRKLDARDAQILMLKYVEAWSYRRIAQHLGVTEATVESRLHRARKKMRQQLARAGLKKEVST